MATEVKSPINTAASVRGNTGPGSNPRPLSPGARSNPSRAEGPKFDSVPPQPPHGSGSSEEPAANLQATGPDE
jgi:hypothetical protein